MVTHVGWVLWVSNYTVDCFGANSANLPCLYRNTNARVILKFTRKRNHTQEEVVCRAKGENKQTNRQNTQTPTPPPTHAPPHPPHTHTPTPTPTHTHTHKITTSTIRRNNYILPPFNFPVRNWMFDLFFRSTCLLKRTRTSSTPQSSQIRMTTERLTQRLTTSKIKK